jgi:CubicO group peptidase (beta-lactamase class C family)
MDYLRFAQMLLNGGELDGERVLSPSTIKLMTSDHLGTRVAAPFQPGELLLRTPGYTFGLGFAVRQGDGIAGVPGSAGEFMWAGYAGTFFWVDPQEELVGIYMTKAPSPIRACYRAVQPRGDLDKLAPLRAAHAAPESPAGAPLRFEVNPAFEPRDHFLGDDRLVSAYAAPALGRHQYPFPGGRPGPARTGSRSKPSRANNLAVKLRAASSPTRKAPLVRKQTVSPSL